MPFLSNKMTPESPERSRPVLPLISEREVDRARPLKVIYIGAGVSGIVGAIQFQKRVPGIDLVIYEKNPDVGGTWYENRYPGCACDVPSLSYQLSFESSTHWSQFYASAPEILAYWQTVASKYDIHKHIKFQHRCVEARWDRKESKWFLTLLKSVDDGTTELVHDSADVLVTGTGTLNEWKWPDIAGMETFRGTLLHSANWDESFDSTGKTVAIIGAGSSGIQIVPALVPKVARMDHYVRGKTWIANQIAEHHVRERQSEGTNGNFSYSSEEKQAWLKDPDVYLRYRKELELSLQGLYATSERDNPRCVGIEQKLEVMMKERLKGKPKLIESLLPRYPPLCKRLTPGPGYLEALALPKVDVITSTIRSIDATGVITEDGQHRSVDAIVCATGFDTSVSSGFPIYGRDGLNLRQKYSDYPRSYLGLCTDGFPNFFQSLGPNSFQGAGSLLVMIEVIHTYIAQVLERLSKGNVKIVEPKRGPVDKFTAYCDEYFKRTVYTADCVSWYKTAPPGSSVEQRMRGRVTALWPGSSVHAMKALQFVHWEDFEMEYVDGNSFGWFGNGWTVADRSGDPEGLTSYLNDYQFLEMQEGTSRWNVPQLKDPAIIPLPLQPLNLRNPSLFHIA
ncbi:flavin-binding monooxygenase [Boeremia exigua]|uniref:flavin-binding monooxygenase n=1 Tax=Boeremia exigua TaxID=749465 RepID=UPI001E8D000E|nr:flavin-binding monooxygenase [Boeremia exigua]KAH6643503.1 flavin-binding monooxygenase [Boeremia exigua]